DTEYLANTYGESFTKESFSERDFNKDFYIENPLSETQFRGVRYVASIAKGESSFLPIQNLVKLYSKEGNIWQKEINEKDLREIDKATTLIKISTDSARRGDAPVNMSRDITLTDGSNISVEYIPYTEENTDGILRDMNQHLDITE
ncbi:hypothetical protein KKA50_02115, partial [Patescibacteria group bacterium]|nr:hypothetical protein [Patescibacteria group bacterium]